MKTKEDKFTAEIFGNRPGRPRKLNAMTGAERVRKHRAQKATLAITVTRNEKCCVWCGMTQGHSGVCMVGQLG